MIKTAETITGVSSRTELLTHLYKKAFPAVAAYISRNGGSLDDARDIFQDSLVIYYEKRVAGKITEATPATAYLLGIARHHWLHRLKKENGKRPLLEDDAENIPADEEPQPSRRKLLQLLEKSGKRCLDLLLAFYYERMPAEKAAAVFGYAGTRSVTVQKYKCLEKIRNEVKEKALEHADFIE